VAGSRESVSRRQPLVSVFATEYRAFRLDHHERVLDLMAVHRYQMNEVERCARLMVALDSAPAGDRGLAFADVGTGAGLALQVDR
jgi:hypothetical protein